MKITKLSIMIGSLISILLVCASLSLAQERKLTMAQLPAAVRKTVEEQTKGATIKGISSEKENGKTQYEVETMVDGKSRDMIINRDGTIAEIEDQIDLSSLSPEVQKTIKDRAGSSTITIVEALSKGGTLQAYEIGIKNAAGKRSEFQVKPDGTLITRKK
ncbi:MAG TPA: hypothetical protein VFC63_09055 [Blastocatellia bacterium]|nr:hypothetical protein [Blastocatellia bacterium]